MSTAADAIALLRRTFAGGGKVLVCGNGGSAADSEHIVGELMKGMSRRRPLAADEQQSVRGAVAGELGDYLSTNLERALPAISLVSQVGLLTAIVNDTAPDMLFAQQVYGYGRAGDALWALSTSGRSRNVVLAAAAAKARGMHVLAMTGREDSPLANLADVCVQVDAEDVATVQELHRPLYHAICDSLEASLV